MGLPGLSARPRARPGRSVPAPRQPSCQRAGSRGPPPRLRTTPADCQWLPGAPSLSCVSLVVLPGLPFASSHGIVAADVRRTFGEVLQPISEAPPGDAAASLGALFPSSYAALSPAAAAPAQPFSAAGEAAGAAARVPEGAVVALQGPPARDAPGLLCVRPRPWATARV